MDAASGTNDDKLNDLATGRILPTLLRFAWPALVSMSLNVLYNIVDRMYIGQGCGLDAIAGLAMTAPISFALGAVGVLIGAGSSAVLSIKLGEKDMPGAERTLGQLVALKLLFGLIVPPLMYFFGLEPILRGMAGESVTPEAFAFARQYIVITIFFNLFSHLAFGLSALMRAEGAPRTSMMCMVVGCVTNILLDPLFIYDRIPVTFWYLDTPLFTLPGLGMKVAGAAWATNLSMMLSCFVALAYYWSGRSVVRLRLRRVRLYRDLAPRVLAIGLAPFLMQLMGSAINFSLNHSFAKWAPSPEEGTILVSAFGIYMSVMFLFGMPAHGVQQGLAPVLGYNWGAKNFRRVRRAFDIGLGLTAVATVSACVGSELFAPVLARFFTDDPVGVAAASRGIRIANSFYWTIFVNVTATTYYQSLGRPKTAILLSLLRQCICLLPVVWFLPPLFQRHGWDPILAIWVAMPVSDVVTQLVNLPLVFRERRKLRRAMKGEGPYAVVLRDVAAA
ncbi:MAG: MATE family efflux transporter [Kiritimatiellia bacterium]|jgi:putative MATE family efflux protein